jgi:hypothetical protein
MSEIETQNVSVELNYYVGPDDPINGVFYSRPVDPPPCQYGVRRYPSPN